MKMYLKIIQINSQTRNLTINKKIKLTRKKSTWKPGDVSAKLNSMDTESDPSDGDDSDNLSKHTNFDDEMASFDKTTIEFFQNKHFDRNVLKFFLGCIPSFDDKIAAMQNKLDETTSNPRW